MHPLEGKFYTIGASLDWFTRLLSMTFCALGWWRHLGVPRDIYADVDAMMRQKRLAMRNVTIIGDVVHFDVDEAQAPLVAMLLSQHFGVGFARPPRWLTRPRRSRRRRRTRS